MAEKFNPAAHDKHAANSPDAANGSPRSGSAKRATPVTWGAIVVALVGIVIRFAMEL
jgi:hypothetical protein